VKSTAMIHAMMLVAANKENDKLDSPNNMLQGNARRQESIIEDLKARYNRLEARAKKLYKHLMAKTTELKQEKQRRQALESAVKTFTSALHGLTGLTDILGSGEDQSAAAAGGGGGGGGNSVHEVSAKVTASAVPQL